jgi:hypothetical protein
MLVCVMHISNEKTDRRVLLRRLAHIRELPPVEARMLVDDDVISENIDLADSDDGFADVERIELPVRHARHDILIEELARVEHPSEVSTLKVLLEGVRPHGGAPLHSCFMASSRTISARNFSISSAASRIVGEGIRTHFSSRIRIGVPRVLGVPFTVGATSLLVLLAAFAARS